MTPSATEMVHPTADEFASMLLGSLALVFGAMERGMALCPDGDRGLVLVDDHDAVQPPEFPAAQAAQWLQGQVAAYVCLMERAQAEDEGRVQ